MSTGVLIALAGLVALVTAAAGFLLGRAQPRAADLERIATLVKELEAARDEATSWQAQAEASAAEATASREEIEHSRAGIDAHFETSAALFGRLAQDYRALFDHFTESADRLGVSEAQTRALVEGVRQELLADAGAAAAGADEDTTVAPEPDAAGDVASQDEAELMEGAREPVPPPRDPAPAEDMAEADVEAGTAASTEPETTPEDDAATTGAADDDAQASPGSAPTQGDHAEVEAPPQPRDDGGIEVTDDDLTIRRDP